MNEEMYDSEGFLITEPEVIKEIKVKQQQIKESNEIKEDENNTLRIIEPIIMKRTYKYSTDEERHNAVKAQKRSWYHLNSQQQKLKSLKSYYVKQLKKTDLKPEIKTKYENKLNEINLKLNSEK